MGLQVGEELIQRKTFKIRRAPRVWGKMKNSISSLLSLGAPGKYSKRSLTVTHTSHLLPAVVSVLWVDFRADTWTHEPRSEPSTPVCPGDMPPHMTLGWSTGGFPHSSVGKESACNAGDRGWIPGSGRPTEEGIGYPLQYTWSSLVAQKESAGKAGDPGLILELGGIPWRRERLSTPVFQPGKFHGLYSPWGHKESDTSERLSLSLSIVKIPWRRKWQPNPVLFSGKYHGQRSLTGYSSWGPKKFRHA